MDGTHKTPHSALRMLLLMTLMIGAGFAASWLFAIPAVKGARGAGLQAYSSVFSWLVAIAFVLLAAWLTVRPKRPIFVLIASLVLAHLSSVGAYLLSHVVTDEGRRLVNAVDAFGLLSFAGVVLLYPLILGGWLFGIAAAVAAMAFPKVDGRSNPAVS